MTDRTTINVSKEAHQEAKEAKKDSESWSDYITRLSNNDIGSNGEPIQEFDWDKFDEKLQTHLAEWEITVNLDQLDLDPVNMDENDVEDVIERYLENNWNDLRRGQF